MLLLGLAATLLAASAVANGPKTVHDPLQSAKLLHRYYDGDEKVKCHAMCNGEAVPVEFDAKKTKPYECWGAFQVSCEDSMKDRTAHLFIKCTGAFMSRRRKAAKDDDDGGDSGKLARPPLLPPNGTETTTSCEGQFLEFVKIISSKKSEDDAASTLAALEDGKDNDLSGSKGVLSGVLCVGTMRALSVAKTDGKIVGGYSCDRTYIDGAAVKRFPQGTARGHIEKELTRAQRVFERRARRGCHRHRHRHHHHHHGRRRGYEYVGDMRDGGAQWGALVDSVRGGDAMAGPGCADSENVATGGPPGHCKLLCNGKKPSWWSKYLPCWGEVEFECKGSTDKMCYIDEIKCEGMGWPWRKSCKGTFVDRKAFSAESKEEGKPHSFEMLDLTTGYKRFVPVKSDGWKGGMSVASGHSSKRYSFDFGEEKKGTLDDVGEDAAQQLIEE